MRHAIYKLWISTLGYHKFYRWMARTPRPIWHLYGKVDVFLLNMEYRRTNTRMVRGRIASKSAMDHPTEFLYGLGLIGNEQAYVNRKWLGDMYLGPWGSHDGATMVDNEGKMYGNNPAYSQVPGINGPHHPWSPSG